MNPALKEINEIIALCDEMIEYISSKGSIRNGNPLYCEYKIRLTVL